MLWAQLPSSWLSLPRMVSSSQQRPLKSLSFFSMPCVHSPKGTCRPASPHTSANSEEIYHGQMSPTSQKLCITTRGASGCAPVFSLHQNPPLSLRLCPSAPDTHTHTPRTGTLFSSQEELAVTSTRRLECKLHLCLLLAEQLGEVICNSVSSSLKWI